MTTANSKEREAQATRTSTPMKDVQHTPQVEIIISKIEDDILEETDLFAVDDMSQTILSAASAVESLMELM